MPSWSAARRLLSVALAGLVVGAGLAGTAVPAQAADAVPIVVGVPTRVTIANTGDVARFSFAAPAGKTVVIHAEDDTFDVLGVLAELHDAADHEVGSAVLGALWTPTDGLGDTTTDGGPYTLTVGAFWPGTGSVTVRLELLDHQDGGTLTPGTPTTVPLTTAGQVVDLTFQGTAGRRAAVGFTTGNLTSTSSSRAVSGSLLRPDGTVFGPFRANATNYEGFFAESREPLDATGTWTLRLDPTADTTGSITVTLWLTTDHTGALTLDVPTTLTFDPGQNASLTFTAVAGRRLAIEPLESSLTTTGDGPASPTYTLTGPDGLELLNPTTASGFADTQQPLPTGGTWTLAIDPESDLHGSFRFVVRQPVDLTITPSFTGPTHVAVGVKGQRARLPFTASAGQSLTVLESDVSWTRGVVDGEQVEGRVTYTLEHDGIAPVSLSPPMRGFLESGPLPASGDWTLVVDPEDETTGSATLRLGFGTDVGGPVTLGTPRTVTFAPGQKATFTFAGVPGRRPNVTVRNATWSEFSNVPMRLLRPDGSEFFDLGNRRPGPGQTVFVEAPPLDVPGTWQVVIDPIAGAAGTETIVIRQPVDLAETVTSGRSRTTRIATPGQNAVLSYTAAVGQRPSVQITDQRWTADTPDEDEEGPAVVTFRGPAGSAVEPVTLRLGNGRTAFLEGPVADVAGTWTATLDPTRDTVGRVTYTPRLVTDVTGVLTPNTGTTTTALRTPGQKARYTFQGAVDQRVAVQVTRSSWTAQVTPDAAVDLRLVAPDGRRGQAVRMTAAQPTAWLEPDFLEEGRAGLDDTGTWTLEVDPVGDTVGSMTFTTFVRANQVVAVTPGVPTKVTVTAKGTDAVLTLPVPDDTLVEWQITGSTFPAARIGSDSSIFFDGGGTDIPRGSSSGAIWIHDAGNLRLRIDPVGPATGSLTITLTETPA